VTTRPYDACAGTIAALFAHDKVSAENVQAKFELGSPDSPSPDRDVRFLRASETDAAIAAYMAGFFGSGSHAVLQHMRMYSLRLAQVCDRLGRQVDARWFLDDGVLHAPEYFAKGDVKCIEKDPSPYIRRNASPAEIARGASVDGEGYLTPNLHLWYGSSLISGRQER